jgi:hypothetical protein
MAIVCNLSGVPQGECDYSCPNCKKEYRGVPDLAGIRAACLVIRARWTPEQLARAEGRNEPLEVTVAIRVWDRMHRKPESGD